MSKFTDWLRLLDEAEETVLYHRLSAKYHDQQQRRWQKRANELRRRLVGLSQAEEVAAKIWKEGHYD